jgi:hypothetical protein
LALSYTYRAVGNGIRTDHPVPDLPFVDDSLLELDDPDAIEAVGRKGGGETWGRTDPCKDGGWVAYTTDPARRDLAWLVRWHPEHGRSVVLYRDDDASSVYMTYWEDSALLFRAGGYWWDGTTWYRPSQVFDAAREVYVNRPVPAALTVSAGDLLGAGDTDAARGQVLAVADVDPDVSPYAGGRRWRDDLAVWASRHTGRHPAGCVVQVTAPELAADQLLGVAELAQAAGIAASTLRSYLSREQSDVPLEQALVSGRSMWSRPVAEDWAEQRRRSSEGVASTMADRDHEAVSVGVKQLWESFTTAFTIDLWERPGNKKRFALRWRTQAAVRDLAQDLAWTVAASLNRILRLGDLSATVRSGVLWQFAVWQRLTASDPDKPDHYPIADHRVSRMLDWLIRHAPDRAGDVVAQIVREAEDQLGIPPEVTATSLRQALELDGILASEHGYDEFFNNALPPQN